MAKSKDEEPWLETASSPSVPVDTMTQGAIARGPTSQVAPDFSPSIAARARAGDEHDVSPDEPMAETSAPSPTITNPMGNQPSSDNNAFCEIVKQHRPYLLNLAWKLSGEKDVAEDLVQETFRRALSHFHRLWSDSHIRAWLSTILTRLFLDYNKHQRVVKKTMRGNSEQSDDVAIDASTPEISDTELRDAIEQLEPELRQVIELSLAGKAYKEIADELHIPIGTVSSRTKRARDRLKELLTVRGAPR